MIPYSEGKEDEQRRRAERLAVLGVLRCVDEADLSAGRLADAVRDAIHDDPLPSSSISTVPMHRLGRSWV